MFPTSAQSPLEELSRHFTQSPLSLMKEFLYMCWNVSLPTSAAVPLWLIPWGMTPSETSPTVSLTDCLRCPLSPKLSNQWTMLQRCLWNSLRHQFLFLHTRDISFVITQSLKESTLICDICHIKSRGYNQGEGKNHRDGICHLGFWNNWPSDITLWAPPGDWPSGGRMQQPL